MTDASSPYIYADNAATTPLSHAALDAMMPFLTETFGNPSGIHRIAREAAVALDKARASVAGHLGAAPDEVYFTSGGSESDNWVLRGAVARWRQRYGMHAPTRIVTSQIEHHAILHCCRALERVGVEVIYLPVDTEGHVSAADLEAALDEARSADRSQGLELPPASHVSIMLATNEVGTIHDLPAPSRLGVDALSLSGHKFHGPRGTGALVLRRDISLPPLIEGGAQERGERAGTENVAGIVGLAAALDEACSSLEERGAEVAALRDRLMDRIVAEVPDMRITGARDARLPGIASFICHDVDGELLVVLLDRAGVAAATGSACSTGSTDPSHVIAALGVTDPSWSHGALRLSLADDVTSTDVDLLCERVPAAIRRARVMSAMG